MEYLKKIMETINKSVNSINEEKFINLVNDCVKTINNNGKIIVSGLGKNVAICDKFVGEMLSMGLPAQFLHTNSAVHGDLGMIKDNDLVIILTKSGETIESINLYSHLKKRKSLSWLLTFEENSTLTREIKNSIILSLDEEGDKWNLVPNNSSTVNLIILQALAIQLSIKMNVQLEEFKRNHPGGHIGDLLK